MRVLFCHDGPLRKDELNKYYGTAHNDETFKRYYNIADELSVVIRVNKTSTAEAKARLSKITVSPFEVIESPNTSNLKGMLFSRRKAKKVIKEAVVNNDYIVARLPSIVGFIAIDFARKLNKPYLVEVVACPWDAFWNHSLIGKLIAPFMYLATKKRVSEASHVVYVTNDFLQRRYPTIGEHVNCSNVSLKEFDDMVIKKKIDKIMSKEEGHKIIIGTTAAVNVRYKGQQYIIEALGKLKAQGINNYEYQLVGGGNQSFLRSIAKKFDVEDQVVFLGALPHYKVFDWLDGIDIYAQPSRQEGLPRALIEAMSRGLPALGARTAGIPELLDDSYIFSNTKSNIDEIISIIKTFDKEALTKQATRDFNEAMKYKKDIIEERRKEFFLKFKMSKV